MTTYMFNGECDNSIKQAFIESYGTKYHTVTFDLNNEQMTNGGHGEFVNASDSQKLVQHGQPVGELPIPIYVSNTKVPSSGYMFYCWVMSDTGVAFTESTIINDDITVYAVWMLD